MHRDNGFILSPLYMSYHIATILVLLPEEELYTVKRKQAVFEEFFSLDGEFLGSLVLLSPAVGSGTGFHYRLCLLDGSTVVARCGG